MESSDTSLQTQLSDRSACLTLLGLCRLLYPSSQLLTFLTEFVEAGTITVLDADQLKLDLQEEDDENGQIE